MSEVPASTRKWAPKRKGGCSTCRARHVRCDKQHPRCGPCGKSSRQCDYNLTDNPSGDPLKVILYQPNDLALRRISLSPSRTAGESRSFHFFRTKVATSLSGYFDSNFWTRDILRVAEHEESVHYGILALSSLSETMLKTSLSSTTSLPEELAIQQQTKAISNLSQKIRDSESRTEMVLITCVLLICFEMFQNNLEAALNHMSNGIYVFYNWRSKRTRESQTDTSEKLALQLERIFGRLLLQTVLFVNTKPQEWRFISPNFTPPLPVIPSRFLSIDEARNCLDGSMCFLYHGMLVAKLGGLNSCDLDEDIPEPVVETSLGPLDEWLQSFKSFMAVHEGTFSIREQKAVRMVEIQHLVASIAGEAGPFGGEMIFDSFEQSFSQLVVLASWLLNFNDLEDPQDPNSSAFPTFDMGILPPLYFTASRCRNPLIRRQALHLLRRGPRQEGIWLRDQLANVAQRILDIEEVGCEGAMSSSDIPASARLSLINATMSRTERTGIVHFCRLHIGAEGATEVIHEAVNW